MLIPITYLKAALLHCNKREVRECLRGVCVESTGHIIATDGHRMFVALIPDRDHRIPAYTIIPHDALTEALRVSPKGHENLLFCATEKGGTLNGIPFEKVSSQFPEWRRVIPPAPIASADGTYRAESGVPYIGINSRYVECAMKALQIIADVKASNPCPIRIEVTPNRPVVCYLPQVPVLIVIMPLHRGTVTVADLWDIREKCRV